jgi:GH25 family lysozyme M1 (1,4-beta-N-acetylmuramidase)
VTLHFPDVYSGQAGISFTGAPAVIVKATQGTGYVNPDFAPAKGRAAAAGAYLMAYHFLEAGSGGFQATHCHATAGAVPLMLDWEEEGASQPGVADAVAFIDSYRKLGSICYLLYLPHWYWQKIGSPSLAPLISRGMLLVSSNYTTYSDTGPGWAAYGGMTPVIWQYTSTATFNGRHPVDFNAFKGTVAELRSLATTGKKAVVQAPPPPPARLPAPAGVSVSPHRFVNASWGQVTHAGVPVARYRAELAKGTPDHPVLPPFYGKLVDGTHLADVVIPEGPVVIRVKAADPATDGEFTAWKAVP